jgi:photosystem II stability/assembly factor-like uncharacterized protein
MRRAQLAGVLMIVLAVPAASESPAVNWQVQSSGVEASLRGLSAVSERVAWASGANGTWLRTVDGGASWRHGRIAGAEELGVRDIHAFDDRRAVALTIASPGRIYRTLDGGATWKMVFEDDRPAVFFNCMDFADGARGYAVGDPIDGRFLFIETLDGGESWQTLPASQRPEPVTGEAQFAASGTCLQAEGDEIWIGTGGSVARIFRSLDRGRSWSAARVPLQQGEASQGVFGLLRRNARDAVIVGGDYTQEGDATGSLALTQDGGRTWRGDSSMAPGGFRSAVVSYEESGRSVLVTVGPSGSDLSNDGGRTWTPIAGPGFHVAAAAADGTVWAAGAEGRVARLIRGSESGI